MAISALTPTRLMLPKNSKVLFASGVSITTTNNLDTLFDSGTGVNVTAFTKSVTLTPPETAHDLQSFLGADANNFQNQLLEEKPPGLATMTGTLIMDEDEVLESLLDISGSAISDGYTRYQLGNSSSQQADVLIQLSGATGTVNIALIDSEVTKWGDVRVSGPDGHWEQDITAICLAKNFYWEYKD